MVKTLDNLTREEVIKKTEELRIIEKDDRLSANKLKDEKTYLSRGKYEDCRIVVCQCYGCYS